MNQFLKRSLSIFMVVVMLLCALPAVEITSSAASYTYNWGVREDVADTTDFTKSTAEEWYEAQGTSYAELSQYTGSSTTSSVPSSALFQNLRSLMQGAVTDTTSYDGTRSMFAYTDCENSGNVISSFYSGEKIGPDWDSGATWNREHTWPNSKGDANGNGENDIFMLRPTSVSENSSRGNKAYGESSSYYHPNDKSGGKYDLRGDVSRIILFVYVRWQNTSSDAAVLFGSDGVIESKDVLLQWMEEDPVDTWELGRNDSCQSITGTRNVFVDYPELGFLLFGADVPDGYTSPSGGASSSYSITATSNNTSYGTVSVSGSTIIASPKTGYYASGYTVTSGTATVTQDGNTFKVSASSDCTIRINFAAKTTVNVSFSGATVAAQSGYAGDSMSLPTADAPEGYNFVGWMTAPLSEDTTTKPSYYTDSFIPTGNTTLYALYSYVEESSDGGSGDYVKVTSAPADWSGEYVIVYEADGYIFNGSLTSFDATSNYKAVTITDNTIAATEADAYKFTIAAVNGGYSIQGTSGGYVGFSSNDNGLTTGTSALVNTISLDASGNANIVCSGGAYLRYNASSNQLRFRYYKSSTYTGQKAIALYLKDGSLGMTYYTTNPTNCEHTNTIEIAAVAATCTEIGYTAGVYCNDCQTYTEGHEVVNATGHTSDDGAVTTAPTCTATGVKTYSCTVCKEALSTEEIAATGHTSDNGAVTTAPTCTATGVKTYTCTVCNEVIKTEEIAIIDHSYDDGVVTQEPTYTETGVMTYTCTACGNTKTETLETVNPVDTYSVSLTDNIGVNFQMNLAETDTVSFTVAGNAVTPVVSGNTYSIYLAAAQMTDEIVISVNGVALEKVYSVRTYADVVLADTTLSNCHELVKAMLCYGAESQRCFGYNLNNMADEDITFTQVDPSGSYNMKQEGSVAGVNLYGATLLYNNKISVRLYFTGSVDGLTFKVGEIEVEPKAKGDKYYIDIAGINPQQYDEDVTIVVSNGTDSLTVSYSPMAYIVRMFNKEESSETTKALVQALYSYYRAAKDYTTPNPLPEDEF